MVGRKAKVIGCARDRLGGQMGARGSWGGRYDQRHSRYKGENISSERPMGLMSTARARGVQVEGERKSAGLERSP